MSAYTIDLSITAKDMASGAIGTITDALSGMGSTLGSGASDVATGAFAAAKGLKNVEDGLNNFIGAIQNSLIVQVGLELNEVGRQANIAEVTFTELAGGAKDADEMLKDLRTSTNNVVDDMTLMSGANRLMVTGLAKSGDEVSALTELGIKLSGAMGVDAKSGIENFSAAILNMSYERLDTLGISASRVRARVAELKEEGYSTEEAFKLATIEQGRLTLERLGIAADASATHVANLSTKMQNVTQDVGQFVNTTVESAFTTVDQFIQILQIQAGTHPVQLAAKELSQEFVNSYYDGVAEYMTMGTGANYNALSAEGRDSFAQAIGETFTMLTNDPNIINNRQTFYDAITTIPHEQKDALIESVHAMMQLQAAEIANAAANEEYAKAQELAAQRHVNAYWGAYETMWKEAAQGQAIVEQNRLLEEAQTTFSNFALDYGSLPTLTDITDPSQLEWFTSILGQAGDDLQYIQQLTDEGLLNETDLQTAAGINDELIDVKARIDEIQGMTLEGLLGQSGGGAAGQIADMLIEQATAGGASEGEVEKLKRTLDLSTGEETAASVALQDEIVPMIDSIRRQLGADAAALAIANVDEYLKQSNFLGATSEEIAAGLSNATGFTTTGGRFAATEGFDAAEYATSIFNPETAESVSQMADDTTTMSDNVTGMVDTFAEVNTHATELDDTIARLTSGVNVITARLVVEGLERVEAVLGAIGSMGGMTAGGNPTNPRNNGGRVPGADRRTVLE